MNQDYIELDNKIVNEIFLRITKGLLFTLYLLILINIVEFEYSYKYIFCLAFFFISILNSAKLITSVILIIITLNYLSQNKALLNLLAFS